MVTGLGTAGETALTTAAGGTGWGTLALLYRQKDKQRKRKTLSELSFKASLHLQLLLRVSAFGGCERVD